MKTFTNKDIRAWNPHFNVSKYLKNESENHNVITILDNKKIPFQDCLWIILRNSLVSDKLMRLFAAWCYRQTLTFIKNPDPRSIAAVYIAEAFANGLATKEELAEVELAARSATRSAETSARSTNRSSIDATWSAKASYVSSSRSAKRDTNTIFWSDTKYSPSAVTWPYAWSSKAAAESANRSAKAAAKSAAWSAAWAAAKSSVWSTERLKLRKMLREGIKTGDVK